MLAESSYSVYVAGIPTKTTKKEIMAYFGQFGPVTDVNTFDNEESGKYPSTSSRRIKGYCIVKTNDKQAYASILCFQSHSMFGRSIACAKYQEGAKLMRLNRLKNQRRIMLTNIPLDLKQEELKIFLETTVGKVEVLHEMRLDAKANNGQHPKSHFASESTTPPISTKSYSVMFSDKVNAQKMISTGTLQGPSNLTFSVSRFVPPSKRVQETNNVNQKQMPASPQTGRMKPAFSAMSTAVGSSGSYSLPNCQDFSREAFKPSNKMYFMMRNSPDSQTCSAERAEEANFRFNMARM